MKWLIRICVVLILCTSLRAQQVDTSSPKAALKSLYTATARADGAALRQILLVDNDPQQELVGAYADMILAGKKMADAAKQKFPGAVTAFAQGSIVPEDAAAIDAANVSMNGDSATLNVLGTSGPTNLRKVDGAWRVVIAVSAADDSPQRRAKTLSLLNALRDAMNTSADEINGDKYTSVQDAEGTVKDRLGDVWAKALAGDAPTSRPATQEK